MTKQKTIACDKCGTRYDHIPDHCDKCGEAIYERMEPHLREKIEKMMVSKPNTFWTITPLEIIVVIIIILILAALILPGGPM